jgi:hypothetical protein
MSVEQLRELVGPDSVLACKGIGKFTAACIGEQCGSVNTDAVVEWFRANCTTAKEVKTNIRKCCPNANAGKEIIRADGSMYKVPNVSEGAACGLLDELIRREAFDGKLMTDVRAMRSKMRGYNTTAATAKAK